MLAEPIHWRAARRVRVDGGTAVRLLPLIDLPALYFVDAL